MIRFEGIVGGYGNVVEVPVVNFAIMSLRIEGSWGKR